MADRRGLGVRGWWLIGGIAMVAGCHSGGATGSVSGATGGSHQTATGGATGTATAGASGSGSGGSGAGTGGAGPGDAGLSPEDMNDLPPLSEDQVCRDAIIAQCERLSTCYGLSSDPNVCAQYADRCPSYYFNPRSLRTRTSVESCIAMLEQATCTDILMGLGAQCLDHGIGAAGAPCSSSSECASGACSGLAPSCGTCSAVAASGAACGGDAGYCGSGQICHPVSRTCVATPVTVAHAYLGDPCDLSADPPIGCVGDLLCRPGADGGTAGTCAGLPGQGEACASGPPQCASGLTCGIATDGGTRTAICGDPVPCGNTTCSADSFCYETPTTPLQCRPYAKPGETCIVAVAGSGALCTSGSTCVGLVDATNDAGVMIQQGTCAVLQELGASCDATHPCRDPFICQDGQCAHFDPETCLWAPADASTD